MIHMIRILNIILSIMIVFSFLNLYYTKSNSLPINSNKLKSCLRKSKQKKSKKKVQWNIDETIVEEFKNSNKDCNDDYTKYDRTFDKKWHFNTKDIENQKLLQDYSKRESQKGDSIISNYKELKPMYSRIENKPKSIQPKDNTIASLYDSMVEPKWT